MNEEVFKRVFQVMLVILSIRLLWAAATRAGYI